MLRDNAHTLIGQVRDNRPPFSKADAEAIESPIGLLPAEGEINTDGLDITAAQMHELHDVDAELVKAQLPQIRDHLGQFGDKLPAAISAQLEALEARLG